MSDTTTDVVPLARPVIGPEEEQAVLDVLRSGQLSLGPRLPAFEEAFAAGVPLTRREAVAEARDLRGHSVT